MKKLILILIFLQTIAYADIIWDLNYGISEFKKNPKSSIEYFKGYINANPNDKDGYWWLGMAYLKNGEKYEGQKEMQKAYLKGSIAQNIENIELPEDEYNNLEDYFDMASMYFEQSDLKEADKYADMMLKIDPDSSSAYFLKAKIALNLGRNQKAREYMEQAVILNSSLLNTNLAKSLNITAIPKLTLNQYSVFAFKSYFQGNIKDASLYAQKYIEQNKTNTDIYSLLADCYIKADKIDMAKKTIDEAIGYNKNNVSLLIKKGQLNNDINIYQKAYKINPNNRELLLSMANYYLKKEDYNNSKKYFMELINIDNSMYEAYFGYAYSLINLGQINKAINEVKILSSLNNKTSEIEFLLSKVCAWQGSYTEALEYIDMAIKKEPNYMYYLEGGKLNFILSDFSKAQKYFSKTPIKSEYEILNYLKLNDYKNAKRILKNAQILDKNKIMYKYNLYKICKLENNENEAQLYLAQIEKIKPQNVYQYIDLAKVYLYLNDESSMNKILKQASEKYQNSPELYIAKLEIYFMSGNKQKLKETISQLTNIQNN